MKSMKSMKITLTQTPLSLKNLRSLYEEKEITLHIAPELKTAVEKSAAIIKEAIDEGKVIYGVDTGFGALANVHIEAEKLRELQRNIICSHKAGVGAYLDENISKLVLALKIMALSAGYSGVQWALVERLTALFNSGYYPCLHGKGSVGASGDLAPLADLAGVLLGEGDVWHQGKVLSAREVLNILQWTPYELGPKEGLSLINGTQVSTALALSALFKTERLFGAAIVSGTSAVEGAKGSHAPFCDSIQRLRRQTGQQQVAVWYRDLLTNSEIHARHQFSLKVQDPYCLRCQPVVMGACLDQMQHVAEVLCLEANAVTDNPLVIPETKEVISGGNFHAEPIAFAADGLALAIAEIASIAERRVALLMDIHFSGLPSFLSPSSGLHSGLMIAHVTAAAMVSENKSLSHPASVDSIPTSANQEDHVSMATYASRRLHDMLDNAAYVIGIELLATLRALSFLEPHKPGAKLENILNPLRSYIQKDNHDHVLTPEIEALKNAVLDGNVARVLLESQQKPEFINPSL